MSTMPDTREEEVPENHVEESDGEGGEGGEGEDRRRRLRRRPRTNKREPAVYVGSIPRGTRVSEFKMEVRGHDVAPMRVMWRGAARHAFLFFEQDSDVEDALEKLSNLEISGKGVKVEKSTEREFKTRNDSGGDYEGGRDGSREGGRGDGNMRDRQSSGGRGGSRGGRGGSRGVARYPEGGQGSPPNRRPRQGRRAPSVFIGGIPRGTRVSDLKAQVRGLGVEPLRVLWRGGAGHTFLFFVKEEEVDEALTKLSELEVNERKLRVERGGQRSESHGSGDEDDNLQGDERSPRQRRPPRRQRNRSLQEDDGRPDEDKQDRGGSSERDRRPRRGPPQGERLPAIYIGAIPRGTRAGEFKTQVREHDLAPFRLILRLGTGHAYLLFQSEDEVQDALQKLENLEINGKKVRVDKSTQEDGKEVDHEVGQNESRPEPEPLEQES